MRTDESDLSPSKTRIDGVVIGLFLGFEDGAPLVVFPGNPEETALKARSLCELSPASVGAEVALLFQDGDPRSPLIVGRIVEPVRRATVSEVLRDGERVEIRGGERVELRCGLASIILEKDGRIVIRGSEVTSQASGNNWVRGGSVHLN